MGAGKEKKAGKPYRDGFIEVDYREPHCDRRVEILRKYPQIKQLFGPCHQTMPICVALVIAQFAIAYAVRDLSWLYLVPLAYLISGTINHCLSLATHEISHFLAFETPIYNQILGVWCNLAMGVPSFFTFRKYHLDHHQYQGVEVIDTDLPSHTEAKIILNNKLTKLMFLILQPAFYALRPQIVNPKSKDLAETINWLLVVGCDICVFYFWGGKSLFWLLGGTLLGLSLHPMAGHFLAEHYVWSPNDETYSYYGPLNFFAWNVGYHVEHHDFPRIPGSRLPKLRAIAPEYYPTNPKYQSWVRVLWDFIWDDQMGSYNRVTRSSATRKASPVSSPVGSPASR